MAIPQSDVNPTKSGSIASYCWAALVSGNDASAAKPCLNPESSSDEGFVESNAAV